MDYNHGKELSSMDFKNLIGGPLVAVVEAQAQAAMSTVDFIRKVGFKPGAPKENENPNDVPSTGEPVYVSFKYPKEVSPYEPAVPSSFAAAVLDGGANYKNPKVAITGGGGSGAIATASLDGGKIASIDFTSYGSGYTSAPTVKVNEEGTKADGWKEAVVQVAFTPAKPSQAAVFQEMKLEVPILSIVPIPYLRVEEVTVDFNAKINSIQTKEETSERERGFELSSQKSGGFFLAKASVNMKTSITNKSTSKATGSIERTYSMAVHVRAVQDEMPGGMEKILGILEDATKSQPISAPKEITI
ncbi:MAG: DUF2589 domain-containing protein [Defluviitaleaceae bacterium]|nr:DUF2589 domain-containing protein [Defluviitaleaceae bacterium]